VQTRTEHGTDGTLSKVDARHAIEDWEWEGGAQGPLASSQRLPGRTQATRFKTSVPRQRVSLRASLRPAERQEAAWGEASPAEHRWQATLAVIIAVSLYATLPEKFTLGRWWLFPLMVPLLLIPSLILNRRRHQTETMFVRALAIGLIAVINLANLGSLVLLVNDLLNKGEPDPKRLILSAMQIWLTNVIVFALWYWELDRGGPGKRTMAPAKRREPDFLFPQMSFPECGPAHWTPTFVDYLYVSFTNATAFSPTDTMPLTGWAKLLMLVQALASLVTVGLVAARAVNILH
jgi:uncharacterized membrane protein